MSDKKFYGIVIGCCGVMCIALIVVIITALNPSFLSLPEKNDTSAQENPVAAAPDYTIFNQLDGRAVSSTEDTVPRVVGIMIDNHPDARPQAGIARARVVYEVPVESPFTRYFAIFNTADTIERVGPVRSARPYFVDLAREYGNPPYLHSGGSPEALTLLKTGVVRDVNEFYWGSYFWRDAQHDAPHNLFTSSTAWRGIEKTFAQFSADTYDAKAWQGWRFQEYGTDKAWRDLKLSATSTDVSSNRTVSIRYNANYIPGWQYNDLSLRYQRTINNELATDEQTLPILADTVLIQSVPIASIDADDRKKITLVGSGKGYVLSRGTLVRATWKKESLTARTRWYDSANTELKFVPGTVWVELVAPSVKIELSS